MTDPTLGDRWLHLTRDVLPAMAPSQHWPIRLDHCFMRVCLDVAMGARWDTVVARPAIRHMTPAQLQSAIAVAERIVSEPSLLPSLNQASLRFRQEHKAAACGLAIVAP